jgi:ribosomal-protein-serine acetyltransferase
MISAWLGQPRDRLPPPPAARKLRAQGDLLDGASIGCAWAPLRHLLLCRRSPPRPGDVLAAGTENLADLITPPPRAPRPTKRLVLEPIAKLLAKEVWEAAQVSLAELRPWMSWAASSTLEETESFASKAEVQWASGAAFHFSILEKGSVIGGISIEVRGPVERIGELGYWIRSDRCGRGFATEAAKSLVDFAFERIGLHRLELRAGVSNPASQCVAEKVGFQREGTLREGSRGAESTYDSYLYGLLASDVRHGETGEKV